VNKNEFIQRVSERLDNDRKAAQDAVDAVLDTIKQ
jgi:nucleoid DNA-binding protein